MLDEFNTPYSKPQSIAKLNFSLQTISDVW